ncbi:UNVERIFIED_CONTAM: hypothetical protein GTU68_054351, partial [Idotea baltica]|nr:hypothetical protein [Idotea baltica]
MPLIAKIAIACPLRQSFDYLIPDSCLPLSKGDRVKVPFRTREVIGFVIAIEEKEEKNNLKEVSSRFEEKPVISARLLALIHWVSDYYHHPIGDCFQVAVPKKSQSVKTTVSNAEIIPLKILNPEQQQAVDAIDQAKNNFNVSLIQGITGSGKTEVYIQLTALMLQSHKQVLILIPEIGLTDQFVARFKQHLAANIVVINSAMNETDRHQAWLLAHLGHAEVVIGTRSAVFTPLERLGLIIIDEEHDSSYKQQDSLRYHARNVALMRSKQSNIPIVLGSATPSLESFYHAQFHRYRLLTLTQRATGASLPKISLIDSRGPKAVNGLSTTLYKAIKTELSRDNQVLLFINKRGYAPILMCHDCQWQATCPHCDAKLIVHQERYQLRCHHCGFNQALKQQCPECQSVELGYYGLGTEQIEQSLQTLFPTISVLRIDRDSTQKVGSFAKLTDEIQQGGAKLLVGTQMLAKGHDFHDVTLVGVLDA